MYDGDLQEVLDNLKKCDGILLVSKPCIEIWFIAHYKQPAETDLSSEQCIKQLKSISGWENYKKAFLTLSQEAELWDKRLSAVSNMKSKTTDSKTYSSILEFIKVLEEASKKH